MSSPSRVPRTGSNGSSSPALDKVTAPGLRARKLAGAKIAALTAYDAISASIVDAAGVDVVLVGDSLANTALGYDNTLPVTLDEMSIAVRSVRRVLRRALLVADMPFGSYQISEEDALRNAVHFVKSGAEAVKIEGGAQRARLTRALVANGIPVMAHIGLTPQSVHTMGGFKVQGRVDEEAERIFNDARALEEAGAFSIVLEGIPAPLAARITADVETPTIGIGAGESCDGQILVFADLLGLVDGRTPKFVRRYAALREMAVEAVSRYTEDVRSGAFPTVEESYGVPQAAPAPSRRPTANAKP